MITLSEFLGAFYPDENEPVWLLGFPAKKLPEGHADRSARFKKQITRQTLAANSVLQANLKAENQRVGMYFVVNAGGTERKDITRINAVFCEIDDISFTEQHALYDQCELVPSIRVETSKSVHAYWLTSDSLTVEQFSQIQNGLITRFKGDEKIKNPNRVMRLPYFNHLAWHEGYVRTPVKLHTFEPTRRYGLVELKSAFPYTPPVQPLYITQGYVHDTWDGIKNELRYRISRCSSYRIESNRTWATAKGTCHSGNNNTALTVNLRTGAVSCKAGCDFERILNAFGLSKPEPKRKIMRVSPREQTSELYQYLHEQEKVWGI